MIACQTLKLQKTCFYNNRIYYPPFRYPVIPHFLDFTQFINRLIPDKKADNLYCQQYSCRYGIATHNLTGKNQVGLDITYEVYRGTSPGVYGDPVYVDRAKAFNL